MVSNQVQYSVLDQRPEADISELCRQHDIKLLCYGTIAGGFLTERYLGAIEPHEPLENRSLTKYKLVIDEFGGWDLFQELLVCLKAAADKHEGGHCRSGSQIHLAKTTRCRSHRWGAE